VIVYEKNKEQRALVRDLTKSLYKAEYKSKLDDEFAQVDLLKAEALLAGMKDDVKTRVARLNEALGLGEGGARDYFPTPVSEDLTPLSPLPDLVKTALDERPEMHAVKSTVGALNEYTSSVKASHYPYLSAFGSFGTLNQLNTGASYTPGWWMGGAMVNVPIYTGGMIRSQVEASHQQALFQSEKLKDLDHRIRYEVVSAHERVRTDLYDVKAYTKAVEEAKLGLEFAQAKYEANLISIVKLTLAEVYLLDTRASLAKSQYRLTVDRAALAFATGRDYPHWVKADGTPRTNPKS
jgi:outer membrane protein TolC